MLQVIRLIDIMLDAVRVLLPKPMDVIFLEALH
jgi:hypothetical protein